MSKFDLGGRRALVLLAALSLSAVAFTACGDDDDDDSSEPSSVALEAAGSEGNLELTGPSEAEAGPAEITLTNNSDAELDGQLAFVAEGEDRSDEEVLAELQNAVQGRPVADWFQAVGGPGFAGQGESTTSTIVLEPGTYYLVPGDEPPQPLTKFTVSGDGDGELPAADGTVVAAEYSFTGEDLKAGEQKLLLDNQGGTWHHFQAFKLNPDATIEDAETFFREEQGRPPFGEELPVESTVMDGGRSELVDANLQPGTYAFVCFISDKTGGPPHIAKGMISEIEVTE